MDWLIKASIFWLMLMNFHSVKCSLILEVKDWNPKDKHLDTPLTTIPVEKTIRGFEVTVCLRFNIFGSFDNQIGFSDKEDFLKFGSWFRLQDDYGFVFLNGKGLIFRIPKGLMRPYSWYHFCFSKNQTHYSIAVNGNLWISNTIRNYIEPGLSLDQLVVQGSGIKRGKQGTYFLFHFFFQKL